MLQRGEFYEFAAKSESERMPNAGWETKPVLNSGTIDCFGDFLGFLGGGLDVSF